MTPDERVEALAEVIDAHLGCSCPALLDLRPDDHIAQAILASPALRDLLAPKWLRDRADREVQP